MAGVRGPGMECPEEEEEEAGVQGPSVECPEKEEEEEAGVRGQSVECPGAEEEEAEAGVRRPPVEECPEVEEEEEAGVAEGQVTCMKTEDLLEMVKHLQKEGSLEPQIEDLIHRISELQQAKKNSSEELGEAQALQETLHRELDSLNGEKAHLEEVLCKKQEVLSALQQHCREHGMETPWFDAEEQLEDASGQHKDRWEFHMLEQRLAQEIRALQGSQEQLLAERILLRTRLQEVERRVCSAQKRGPKTELEKFEGQTESSPEARVGRGEPGADCLLARRDEELLELQELTPTPPKP